MEKKTIKCHFIPKVYLRQWHKQNKGNKTLYCFDYMSNEFIKSAFKNSIELGLNEHIFQEKKLYTQIFENELQKIENNYNSWLSDIDNLYEYQKKKRYACRSDIINDETGKTLYWKFHLACTRMIYFCFVQWIRFKEHKQRFILFNFFKDLMLLENTDYLHLFCNDILTIDGEQQKTIGFSTSDDKNIYKYAFGYIDFDKLNNLKSNKYQVLIDHSLEGEFVTSTNPVTQMFAIDDHEPFCILFPLSPYYVMRIEKQNNRNSNEPLALPCTCTDYDVRRMNLTQFINNPDSMILAGNQDLCSNVMKNINPNTINEAHDIIIANYDKQWSDLYKDTKFLDFTNSTNV